MVLVLDGLDVGVASCLRVESYSVVVGGYVDVDV